MGRGGAVGQGGPGSGEVRGEGPRAVLDRLRAVDQDDWERAFAHRWSRALLMREHMRRAALWAEAYGVPERWPFFDVAELARPGLRLGAGLAAEADAFAATLAPRGLGVVCRAAVRWAAVGSRGLPELPHPYEPVVTLFGRGGGYSVGQMIDLDGISVPYGSFAGSLALEPFVALDARVLDMLDATAGERVTYYADAAGPGALVLARLRTASGAGGEVHEEVLVPGTGSWVPADFLRGGRTRAVGKITTRQAASVMRSLLPR
ncbi:hypothetical protein ACIBCB_32740 [Streptomyces uncialis]|uniref:hypothetical protein n=1 Tax=Streptomyces uncialis TaxID=1048205 RepID=UPI00379B0DF1